ncbi:hypothetical protein [Nocardia amikacinitolerans]|uniref:hypothetical protein n=1 Tax=Nocardia amikacinitolerans TaxID=756689 RepID=UPI0020A4B2EA|nr:hypothetical protein [Nocardia amikacinitolerans]MCP2278374.1 hypothetical protein [Nocardia amikacinitolerans]MCP2299059.1 hypothetical protein [Nocardia amikacinitolerans]
MNRLCWAVAAIALMAVVSISGTGCGSLVEVDTAPDVETSNSPEFVKEATEYGGWTLPPNGKVLLARKEVIRDTEYKLAVEMSPSDLVWMLDKSGFVADFRKLFEPTLVTTIAGPDLASSPNVQKAQDTFTSPKGKVMFRRVAVDERTPETRIVHIEFQGI